MYNFLLDADALIKLAHSSILATLCKNYPCYTTLDVKEEAVEIGKKRLYPDALLIGKLIKSDRLTIKKQRKREEGDRKLGKGEISILRLSSLVKGIIITDDQAFIRVLEKDDNDFFTPTDIILFLKRKGRVTKGEARRHLDNMSGFISSQAYNEAIDLLEEK
jgi:hypothetical protein